MGETTKFPMIECVLAARYPDNRLFGLAAMECRQLATELRALLAERDALAAKWEDAERRLDDEKALRFEAQRPAARRLREYKGVRYQDGAWYTPDGKRYEMASGVVWNKSVTLSLTDLDIPALLALRDDPWEPVETLEKAVDSAADRWLTGFGICISTYQRVQLGVLMVESIRTWLAQQPAPTLTAAQHVEALVGMGAKQYSNIADDEMRFVGRRDLVLLPREANP